MHIYKNNDELSVAVAEWMVEYIVETLKKQDRFTLVLSGGGTPQKLNGLLAASPYKEKIDWSRVHIFWGDERFVPYTDERNNAKMAFDELLSHVPVPKEQIHIMQTDIDPVDAAADYQQLLHNYFDKQLYTFDLVLLGLGNNSHTLSLFPGYDDIVFDRENWVRSFYLKEQDMYRITLTSAIVNTAGRVVFLVAGKDKAEALKEVTAGKYDPANHPAQMIKPLNGELYWFTDKAASGL